MILFYLLISVMPLTRHPLWGMFMGEFTIIKYLGGACLGYALLHAASRPAMPAILSTMQVRCFLLLALLAISSFLLQGNFANWKTSACLSYLSFLLLVIVTLLCVDSLGRLRGVLLATVASVAFASLYVVREWQKYHSVYAGFRPGWVVGDPNYFSVSAVLCLPVGFCLIFERRPRWERLFCLGCVTVILVAATLAASRGGFFGLMAALSVVIWRSRHRIRNFALAAFLVLPMSIVSPASPLDRLLNPGHGDEDAIDNRTTVWKAGLRMMGANPALGIGIGRFKELESRYAKYGEDPRFVAHNSYIEIGAELGIPALIAFLLVFFFSIRTLHRVRVWTARRGPPLLQIASIGIEAGLVGGMVSIFFVSGQYQKLLWLMIFLSASLPSLVRATAKRQSGTKVPAPGELVYPRRETIDVTTT